MKKNILLSVILVSWFGLSAQKISSFSQIPESLKEILIEQLESIKSRDTTLSISGSRKDFNDGNESGTQTSYTYRFKLTNGKIVGEIERNIKNLNNPNNVIEKKDEYEVDLTSIYCCKDTSHNPKHSSSSKSEMLELQRKNKCSKIGICIL